MGGGLGLSLRVLSHCGKKEEAEAGEHYKTAHDSYYSNAKPVRGNDPIIQPAMRSAKLLHSEEMAGKDDPERLVSAARAEDENSFELKLRPRVVNLTAP